jgi:hypothetical protein
MAALAAHCLHPDPQRRARVDGGDVEEVAPAGKPWPPRPWGAGGRIGPGVGFGSVDGDGD